MSFNFGGTAASKPAFGFGAPATATATTAGAGGFSFGQTPPAGAAKPTATISSGFSFGGTPGQPAAATGFGAPAATLATTSTTGFGGFGGTTSFGTPAASTASTGLGGFGTPAATTAATGFGGFGAPAATKPVGFGGFGTTTTMTSAGFGGLGVQTTAANALAKPAFGFGGGLGQPATTSALGFGGATAAPAASTGGFGFGSTAPAMSFGGTTTTTAAAAPAPIGLGGTTLTASTPFGVPTSSLTAAQGAQPSAGGPSKPGKDDSWKDTAIPPELGQDVDTFRKFVKEQKGVSTDMSHLSLPKLHQKIQSDVDGLNAVVKQLGAGVAKQKAQLERLKKDCAKELVNVEVAQRTKDTPPALQYENNNGPIEYFHRLLANFESQMIVYKRQIEDVEQFLQSLALDPSTSTPETLIKAMQKTHAAFVSLAGRYQPLHESIQQQKSFYVQQYRQKHGTTENPFGKKSSKPVSSKGLNSIIGPSPFTGKPDPVSLAKAAAQQTGQPTTQVNPGPPALGLGNTSSFGFGGATPSSGFGTSGGSAFNTSGLGSTSMFNTPAKPAFGQGTLFNSPATSTAGLLGTTMSPFGQQQQQQTAFGFGGKRGKH